MRVLLFLAAWGVVASGAAIDPGNPPASIFRAAAGPLGYAFFGLVMWSAAITSVTGATFTSVSFLLSSWPRLLAYRRWLIAVFIGVSLLVFLWVGRPVRTLVVVGALNGLILPLALAVMLLAVRRSGLLPGAAPSAALRIAGWLVVLVMGGMALAVLAGY